MCVLLFTPPTPQGLLFLCSPPTYSAEVSCVLAPAGRSRFLLSLYFLCALYSQQSDDVFCMSCYLSMHSCLSVLFGRPWCQAGLPVKTSWVVQSPCHLGWCHGKVTSSSLQPQCYFVLNTIDTLGAFDVKTMKKWNRWVYSIFILAIWFSTNYFWGAIMGKIRAFLGNISDFGKQLFSSLPVANAKKCLKSKWTIKIAHEARNSFCYLCLNMVIKKSNEVSFPLFFGRGSSWQLNIDFLVLVQGEINFVSEFCILQESFENVIPFDGEKGQIILIFCILNFIKMKYPQGWRRIVFIIFWISGVLCYKRAHVLNPLWNKQVWSRFYYWLCDRILYLGQGVSISLSQLSGTWILEGQGGTPEPAGARREEAGWWWLHLTRDPTPL